jgi:hypothetical protein
LTNLASFRRRQGACSGNHVDDPDEGLWIFGIELFQRQLDRAGVAFAWPAADRLATG